MLFASTAHVATANAAAQSLQGRLTLLLGPPGAGKTTLLRSLAGQMKDNKEVGGWFMRECGSRSDVGERRLGRRWL